MSRRADAGPVDRHARARGQATLEFVLVAPILFVLLLGIFEAGRFILFYEVLNHATREGARYAIVHGARSECPSGPPPPGEENRCDPSGAKVKAAVRGALTDLAATGGLLVHDPVWTSRGSLSPPRRGDPSTGNNDRGEYVSVFVDYTYLPILEEVSGIDFLPTLTVSAEATLVINH